MGTFCLCYSRFVKKNFTKRYKVGYNVLWLITGMFFIKREVSMKKIKKITALLLIAFMIVGVLPVAQLGQGQGVQAATADEIVKDAASWINYTKYVLGGTDLEKGCDCSGFVCAIFKRHGLDLVRDYGLRDCEDFVRGVSKYGKIVGNTPDKMRDGYIIVFDSATEYCAHAGICTHDSNGIKEVIHASYSRQKIVKDAVSYLTAGSNALKIRAIIKPNVIDGKTYSTVVRNPSSNNNNNDPGGTTTPQSDVPASENPGHPYALQKNAINQTYGDAVRWLQTALNNVLHTGLVVDGAYGPLTEAAVKQFQTANGLTVTGKATAKTVRKITKVFTLGQKVTNIKLDKATVNTLQVGGVVKLNATITPESAKGVGLTWTSSDNSVAKVTATGKVTACKIGTAVIKASAPNGVVAEKSITVTPKVRKNQWFKGYYYDNNGKKTKTAKSSWKKDSHGRWYGNKTGWYAKSQWLRIDNFWFYFDSSGYVYQNGWTKVDGKRYYFNKKNGRMASNEWIEGRFIAKDGVQSYEPKADWKQNESGGWYYQDSSGWYAKNGTVKIDGKKYKFDANGICTNKN